MRGFDCGIATHGIPCHSCRPTDVLELPVLPVPRAPRGDRVPWPDAPADWREYGSRSNGCLLVVLLVCALIVLAGAGAIGYVLGMLGVFR